MRRSLFVVVAALATVFALVSPAGAASKLSAKAAPSGANRWGCKPSAAHPRPVVLVHGTGANMSDNWSYVSPALAAAGYCVFALNYGGPPRFAGYSYGLGPLRQSAQQLSGFVDKVLAATGATQVDMVGHSQGGMMPRWYIRFLGGAAKVHELIGLAPSNHGSTLDGLASLQRGHNSGFDKFEAKYCAACIDQTAGSQFLTELNAGHEVEPGVAYTVIETKYDEVVTPYRSAFLNGGRNITLQNACAFDVADHLGVAFDPVVLRLIENELDPAHAVKASCKSFVPSR